MYRPEGLVNPHADTLPFTREVHIKYDEWEAGADAMLEAIWKMAKESPTRTFTFDTNETNILSVSIPEE